jgi:glutathione S-transferase
MPPNTATMSVPILYVFAISHYCEKARWALDRFGIDYSLQHTMPGINRRIAKKLGASSGSLPFLKTDVGTIAGSGAIIDWGEAHRQPGTTSLAGAEPARVCSFEKRLDDVIGVHIRRFYYSDALLTDPASVRLIFTRDLPLLPRLALTLGWRGVVPKMIALMDLGTEQGLQSRDIVMSELDWLDGLLSDGRPFLTGDQFSRADLTAAALLAPLVNPPKHPTYAALALPVALAATIREWAERPVLRWVSEVYERQR